MDQSAPYIHFASLAGSIPEITPDTIVSRTLYTDDKVKVIVFGFAAGQELSEHTASMPAVIHILRGEADVTVGGDVLDGRPGLWVHMTPRLSHSIVARTDMVMLLLMFK
ncbi:cupin domain-containing protein [Aggregatilinea lenta]|uniref:cupin domain-containing protein n=1 Tax=Aggregatilinea lenta TaxID=913108 RepID=UPI001EE834CB|nr:cupin domain-containing protein [Aggregatilinea lenta]